MKLLTWLQQELTQTIRHPNREVIPILFYAVLTFLALGLGFVRIVPEIDGYNTARWMMPNLVAFAFLVLTFLHANWRIAEKRLSGYLENLRTTATPQWEFVAVFVIDALILAVLKSSIILVCYVVLFGNIGPFHQWLVFLAIMMLAGVFWASLGIIVGLTRKEPLYNTHVFVEIFLPLLVMSGMIFPVEFYPGIIGTVLTFLPTTIPFDLARSALALQPWNGLSILMLILWDIFAVGGAFLVLRWEER